MCTTFDNFWSRELYVFFHNFRYIFLKTQNFWFIQFCHKRGDNSESCDVAHDVDQYEFHFAIDYHENKYVN